MDRPTTVDWKLIFQLSLFGLAMGIATVFFIPSKIEPLCWLAIFVLCAVIIAKRHRSHRFLYGLLLGLVNSVWITLCHILLFGFYISNHPQEAAMMKSMPMPDSPRLMMAFTGPMVGLISGVIIGLFALVAGAVIKSPVAPVSYSGE